MSDYIPAYGYAPEDTHFKTHFQYHCIQSVEEMREFFQAHKDQRVRACDTETTGLTYGKDVICGVSLSFSAYDGVYIPVRHKVNSLPEDALLEIVEFIQQSQLSVWHNAMFDLLMFDFDPLLKAHYTNTKPSETMAFCDTMTLAYLADSNVKRRALKSKHIKGKNPRIEPGLAKVLLGREVPDYAETLGKHVDFSHTDPLESAYYACCDSADTYGIFQRLFGFLQAECPFVLKLDHLFTRSFVDYYNGVEIPVDAKAMDRLYHEMSDEKAQMEQDIFEALGKVVNLNSLLELGNALYAIGVDTKQRTSKGMKLDKPSLLAVADRFPVARQLVERKHIDKLIGTYVKKLSQLKSGRVNYRIHQTVTGRLASGTGGKNKYYMNFNMQNVPKPDSALYLTTRAYDVDSEAILGWRFFEWDGEKALIPEKSKSMYSDLQLGKDKETYLVEGLTKKRNIRSAFPVRDRETEYFVSLDYSGQELRIPAGLSKDPIWYNTFKEGGDPHKALAIMVYGKENYDKIKRRNAKAGNFGLQYRGSFRVLVERLKMPEIEARAFEKDFWKAMRVLRNWQDALITTAKRTGVVTSAYGRPRRVGYYFRSLEWSDNLFGERTVCNHVVQSTAGDVLKIVMTELWKRYFRQRDPNISFHSTVHDEVNFMLRKEVFREYLEVLLGIMTTIIPGSDLPLTLGIDVGYSYGELFTFSFDPTQEGLAAFSPVPD